MKTHIFPVPSIPLAHALNAKVTEIVFAADKRTCNFPLLPDLVANARKKRSRGKRNYPTIEISESLDQNDDEFRKESIPHELL